MKCNHPRCTGVHDNNRYHELCPRSLSGKRDRDRRYYGSCKGQLARIRNNHRAEDLEELKAQIEVEITMLSIRLTIERNDHATLR